MTPAAENLRVLLEARDIDGFLTALEAYRQQHPFEPVVTALTQRVFPPLLRTAFQEERLPPAVLARLYRMVRSGQLVLVENDLLVAINLRIDDAIREVEPATVTPVPPLVTKEDVRPKAVQWSPPSMPGGQRVAATEMKRIAPSPSAPGLRSTPSTSAATPVPASRSASSCAQSANSSRRCRPIPTCR